MKSLHLFSRFWRVILFTGLVAPTFLRAQEPLTLREALARGAAGNVANQMARTQADGAAAMRLAAWRSALPGIRIEAGYLRTTDPVGAFGTNLRQQRITQQDFDPNRLNFPPAIDNFTGAVVIEQPILALDGWLAARAAARGSRSASLNAEWAAMSTETEIIDAWYGAVVAADRAGTLAAATRAADAHARQAALMLEAGLVTKSDVLLAQARAGELEAQRLDAVRDSVLAGRRLGTLIGGGRQEALVVRGVFPDDTLLERAAREIPALEIRPRSDIEAARAAHASSTADVHRAAATLVPRVVSFARRDFNSAVRPLGGASNWSVGVMASWSLFTGAAEIADRRGAEARKAGALAQLAGAESYAGLELERTALTLDAAVTKLSIARRNVEHAQEAHRIVARKYAGGLATVVELLDAAAAEMQSRLGLAASRHGLIVAMAERLQATGHSPSRLTMLDAQSASIH